MSNTAIILQARTGSNRFPHKVARELGQSTVLGEIIKRCLATDFQVILAVPAYDKDLCNIAGLLGADSFCYDGNENDLLGRYYEAAEKFHLDYIIRCTADCPLLDPRIVKEVSYVLRINPQLDYVSNVGVRSFPKGLDVEAFTFNALATVNSFTASFSPDREHCTPPIVWYSEFAKANIRCPIPFLGNKRWTIDYPEDLEFIRKIYPHVDYNWRSVLKYLEDHPEIQNPREEKAA